MERYFYYIKDEEYDEEEYENRHQEVIEDQFGDEDEDEDQEEENESMEIPYGHPLINNRIVLRPLFPITFTMSPINSSNKIRDLNEIGQCMKYKNIYDEFKMLNQTCSICTENFTDEHDVVITSCFHIFCNTCIGKWILQDYSKRVNCPICRHPFV
jgi:hypothetical protein